MSLEDELRDLSKIPVPDLSKPMPMDPNNFPPIFNGEFISFNWEMFLDFDTDNPDASKARMVFFFPLLPFIKFTLPLSLPDNPEAGLLKLQADLERVWSTFQELKTGGQAPTDTAT